MKPYFFNATVKCRISGKSGRASAVITMGKGMGIGCGLALERVLQCRRTHAVTFTDDHSDSVLHKNQHCVGARLSGALHLS